MRNLLGGTFNFNACNMTPHVPKPRLSEREIALAYCTLFAMPGTPFLYYGDEIGADICPCLLKVEYARNGSHADAVSKQVWLD